MNVEWIDNDDVVRQTEVPDPGNFGPADVVVDYLARNFYQPLDYFDGTGPLIDIRSPVELVGSYLCRFQHAVLVGRDTSLRNSPFEREYQTLSAALETRDLQGGDIESFSRIARLGVGFEVELLEGQHQLLTSSFDDLAAISYRMMTDQDGGLLANARNEWEHELMSFSYQALHREHLFDRCILARSKVTGEIGILVHRELENPADVSAIVPKIAEFPGLYPHLNSGTGDLEGVRFVCFLPATRLAELAHIIDAISMVGPTDEVAFRC